MTWAPDLRYYHVDAQLGPAHTSRSFTDRAEAVAYCRERAQAGWTVSARVSGDLDWQNETTATAREYVEMVRGAIRRAYNWMDERNPAEADRQNQLHLAALDALLAVIERLEVERDAAYSDAQTAEHRASLVFESEREEMDRLFKDAKNALPVIHVDRVWQNKGDRSESAIDTYMSDVEVYMKHYPGFTSRRTAECTELCEQSCGSPIWHFDRSAATLTGSGT